MNIKISNLFKNKSIHFALNFLLAAIFIIAGISKLFDPTRFGYYLKYVYNFPDPTPIIIATIFPIIEIILGLFILFRIQYYLSTLIIRVLIIIFVVLHIYKRLIINNPANCNCFGDWINLDENIIFITNIFLLIITFIISTKKEKTDFYHFKNQIQNYFRTRIIIKVLWIVLFVFIISLWVYFRMLRIDRELSSGLITTINNGTSKNRIINILEQTPEIKKIQNTTLFVFLRSPSCATCLEEILFWNTHSSRYSFNIFFIYPSTAEGNEKSLKKLFKIKFPILRISDNYYREILGKYPRIYARLLITANYEIYKDMSIVAENDVERRSLFMDLIKDFRK